MSLSRIVVFACVAALANLMSLVGLPAPAHAQGLPPGSYLKSCTVSSVNTVKGVLSANCEPKVSCGFFSGCDLALSISNVDFPYRDCAGDLGNNDGSLYCVFDQAKVAARAKADAAADKALADQAAKDKAAQAKIEIAQQTAAATPGLRSAAAIVLGIDLGNAQIDSLIKVARSFAYLGSRNKIIAKDFSFTDAVLFLKAYISQPDGAKWRAMAIDNAFLEVLGRASTPAEQVGYDAQVKAKSAWYTTIVIELKKKLSSDPTAQHDMVVRAFQAIYGRAPSDAELAKSTGADDYRILVNSSRSKLWGAPDELVATVARALGKNGRPVNDAAIKGAIVAYTPGQLVYVEMTSGVGKAKLK